ncbi:TPA: hypothetical protein ACHJPA_004940, partial [Escherichia coli]
IDSYIIRKVIDEKNAPLIKSWHHLLFIILYGSAHHHATGSAFIPHCYLVVHDCSLRVHHTQILV